MLAALAVALLVVGVVVARRASESALQANERAAVAGMLNIYRAQQQMQAFGGTDVNGNGQGSYAFLAELAGAMPMRCADPADARLCDPPVLAKPFQHVSGGRVQTGGYVFQMFLPRIEGGWTAELPNGGGGDDVDDDDAETRWLCYAWPIEHGVTGVRAFVCDQDGNLLACNMATELYSGDAGPVPGVSAFQWGPDGWRLAANEPDARGNSWVVT